MFENIRADYALHRSLLNRALWALAVYRFGRWSMQRKFAALRWLTSKIYGVLKIFSEIITGANIDRGVQVGRGFNIVHPEHVRVLSGTIIGDNVGIMHGVTIGTAMFPGAPVIGNNVFIGCYATIIGNIRIGDGARIAANTLVIADVPAGTTAIGVPARILRARATRHPARGDERGSPVKRPVKRIPRDPVAPGVVASDKTPH